MILKTVHEKLRTSQDYGSMGLYHVFARQMDPELGRFVSLDPQLGKLSAPQTMNRYVYCANNPLRFTDPTGQWFWVAIGAAVGAIVTTAIYLATTDNPTLEGALLAALAGAVAGAVTALTFNPAVGMAAASGVVGSGVWATLAGGAMAGAAGSAASYFAEGGFKTVLGRPFEWSPKAFFTEVGIGFGAGALGAGAGKGLGKLFSRFAGQSYDDIMKGVAKGGAVGGAIVSQLPEEMISQMSERLIGKLVGLEEAIVRHVSIGVFPQKDLTAQSLILRSAVITSFTE